MEPVRTNTTTTLRIDLDHAATASLVAELANAGVELGEPGPSHGYSPETIGEGRIQFWPDAQDDEDEESQRPNIEHGSFVLAVRHQQTETNGITWASSRVVSLGEGTALHETGTYRFDEVASDRVSELLTKHGLGDALAGEWTNA